MQQVALLALSISVESKALPVFWTEPQTALGHRDLQPDVSVNSQQVKTLCLGTFLQIDIADEANAVINLTT